MALPLDPVMRESLLNTQPVSKDDETSQINQLFEEGEKRLCAIRLKALEGILHYSGEQGFWWNPRYNRWTLREQAGDYIQQPSINLVMPACDVAYSQFMREEPEGVVVPNSTDERDRRGAQAADRIRRAKNLEDAIPAKLRRAVHEMIITGDTYAFSYIKGLHQQTMTVPKVRSVQMFQTADGAWAPLKSLMNGMHDIEQQPPALDPASGTMIFQQQAIAQTDDQGNPITEEIPSTDIDTEILSTFQVFLDFDADNFEAIRYFGMKVAKSLDWIGDTFGEDMRKKVETKGAGRMVTSLTWKINEIMMRSAQGLAIGLSVSGDYNMQNACEVKTFVQKPTTRFPRGRMKMIANDAILYSGDNPWHLIEDRQQLGLVQFGYTPIPCTAYHFGLPKNIIDLVRRVRGIHAMLAHNRKTMGFPQWIVPAGCDVPTDRMIGKPGFVMKYDHRKTGGGVPQRLAGVDPGQSVMAEAEMCKALIDTISGNEGVLRGEQPFSAMPALSLNMLAEQAGTRFVKTKQDFGGSLTAMDCQRLKLMRLTRRWQTKQITKVLGRSGQVDVGAYEAADMRENYDVRYEVNASKASSRTAHLANLQAMATMVPIPAIDLSNPINRIKYREDFGAADYEDKESADYSLARFENTELDQGRPVEIQQYENYEIHRYVHVERTKQPDFKLLPPEIQQMYWEHITQTAALEQQVEQAAAAVGVGDQTGAEGAPGEGAAGPNGAGGPAPSPAPGGNGAQATA